MNTWSLQNTQRQEALHRSPLKQSFENLLLLLGQVKTTQTLQMMGQKADAKLTPDIARQLCQRTGSAAVLEGSIAQIGTPYLLTVKAVNCARGEMLASTEAQASDKSHVLDALGKVASEIRNELGESLSTVQKFDTPLEQATTPSLEALKAFSLGFQIRITAGDAAAVPFYRRAIELDPNFALACLWLGLSFNNMGKLSKDVECTRQAYELRDRTSEPEKYFIAARFHKVVTGNLENAEEALQLWIQAYPAWHNHIFAWREQSTQIQRSMKKRWNMAERQSA